jgi:single-stranded-DNA-specific exonuclease
VGSALAATFQAEPYAYDEARALADELDLADPVAIALVRRGHRTPDAARAFLAADELHDPSGFEGIERAVGLIRDAIGRGDRITVHGDYDVDGICSTSILISALRRAGADSDWIIPDRLADGYGLSAASVAKLKERSSRLLVTADCGITSADVIAEVAEAGIAAVVTDHHQPGQRLPDCPIVHPVVSGYPFPSLCGAGVAHKLVEALEHALGSEPAPRRDLDLVALATVADLVPLVGENRALARAGLAELRLARRPGLRALFAAAQVEPERLDEGDVAFRIAPRLNAAGRLYRADAGVELMLTDDPDRAHAIAGELDSANHERRLTEREVSNSAEAALRERPEEDREAAAIVVAGEGWHPGVVGIVASRLVERHGRPAIVLSIDEEGRARGSGRSVAGFDLLAALDACAGHLDRYGGHRAAAGVELAASEVEPFRRALATHAAAVSPEQGFAEPERIDAVVGAEALDLRVAEQLESLAPFGQGNPAIRLLVPSARVGDVRPMGEEGKHARFRLQTGNLSAAGVAFNSNAALEAAQRTPHDLTVRLEVNHWNGAVEPRAVLSGAHDRGTSDPARAGDDAHHCAGGDPPFEEWWERFDLELARDLDVQPARGASRERGRRQIDARRGSVVATITELLSSGERVLVLTADAARRGAMASAVAAERLGGAAANVCLRCSGGELASAAGDGSTTLLITDWSTLSAVPAAADRFRHIVLVDPPPSDALLAIAGAGEGYAHRAWGSSGDLAELCWEAEWGLRSGLADVYRGLVARELAGEEVRAALLGGGRFGRSPESAARCVRVLSELGIAKGGGSGDARWLRVVSSERTALERSSAWGAYSMIHQEGLRYLQSLRTER